MKNSRFIFLQACVALFGAVILALSLRPWGVVVHSDSAAYQVMARCLSEPPGTFTAVPDCKTLTMHFPPLFPLIIASIQAFGISFMSGIGWMNVFLFACNIVSSGCVIRMLGGSAWAGLAGSLLLAIAPDMLDIHSQALTEPLFIFFTLLALIFLAQYMKTDSLSRLVLAAGMTGLACVTRFAGIALVFAGTVSLLFWAQRNKRTQAGRAGIFACIGMIPIGFWWLRNYLLYGSVLDRRVVFHPVNRDSFHEAAGVFCDWFLTPQFAATVKDPIFFFTLVFFLFFAWQVMRAVKLSHMERTGDFFMQFSLLLILAVLFYAVFLVYTICFLDGYMTFSHRYLLPVYLFGMILFMGWISRRMLLDRASGSLPVFVGRSVVVYLLIFYGIESTSWFLQQTQNGYGYAGRVWRQSATLRQVQMLGGRIIYSNLTTPIYMLTGKTAFEIPWPDDPMNQRPNVHYGQQLDAMMRDIKEHSGILVYFDGAPEDLPVDPLIKLAERLPLKLVERCADGAIYSVQ